MLTSPRRISPSGPIPASVMIVGEAPGETEERMGFPFVGASGSELRRMLTTAGFDPNKIRFTNVFLTRPERNDIETFCGPKKSVPKDYPYPPLKQGKYFLPQHLHELQRLAGEITQCNPDLIIAVGNVPCWALLQRTGISKLRGSIFPNELVKDGPPVFPTYHPAAVLRQWELRTIVIADLIKAKRFLTEGFHPPHRSLILNPTLAEVQQYLEDILDNPPPLLSFDIETLQGTITCIGFAPSKTSAICVPFFDPDAEGKNFWPTQEIEVEVFKLCKKVLESSIPKLGQNGLYDIQYCFKFGIRVNSYHQDTMIKHHSLFPEMEKGLGFLGSIYTDEAPWKLLRDRNKDNLKADDE